MMVTFGRAVLAAGLVAGGVAGCRTPGDMTLAGPPRRLIADHRVVTTTTGGAVSVSASLRDANGSMLSVTNLRWNVFDSTVAVVVPDTAVIPGSFVARATIVGRARTGGWTLVIVAAAGSTDTIRVAVLPNKLDASLVAYAGAARPDTVVRPALFGPPPQPAVATVFNAPDTLIINGTAALQFDTAWSGFGYVRTAAGPVKGYIASKTPTQLKLVFISGAAGPVVVQHLLLATGDSSLRTIKIDSLLGDSIAISRQRFTGAVTVVGDTMTLTAGSGVAFSPPYFAPGITVKFDTVVASQLGVTNTQARVRSPVTYSGFVTVSGMLALASGAANLTLGPLTTVASHAVNAATFPGPLTTGGRLLDTVTVHAAGGASPDYPSVIVPASYPCTACRYGAWVVFSSPDSVRFISPVGVNGPILLSAVLVGAAYLPMYTHTNLVVSGTVTGEPNEPGNDSAAGATPLTDLGGGAQQVFGALNSTSDTSDYYRLTFTTPKSVSVWLYWIGNGSGDAANPDFDVVMCDSLSAGVCAAATDLFQGMGSTKHQGEFGSAARVPPGWVWIRVVARSAFVGNVAYRLSVLYGTVP